MPVPAWHRSDESIIIIRPQQTAPSWCRYALDRLRKASNRLRSPEIAQLSEAFSEWASTCAEVRRKREWNEKMRLESGLKGEALSLAETMQRKYTRAQPTAVARAAAALMHPLASYAPRYSALAMPPTWQV